MIRQVMIAAGIAVLALVVSSLLVMAQEADELVDLQPGFRVRYECVDWANNRSNTQRVWLSLVWVVS